VIKLTSIQLQKLSDIFILIGGIVFGSMVIPFLIKVDQLNPQMLILGLLLSVMCWVVSLWFVKGLKK